MSIIAPYLTESITYLKSNGFDQWSNPIAPDEIPLKACFEERVQTIRRAHELDPKSEEALISTGYFIIRNRPVSVSDFIQYGSVTYKVLGWDRPKEFRLRYLMVYVG